MQELKGAQEEPESKGSVDPSTKAFVADPSEVPQVASKTEDLSDLPPVTAPLRRESLTSEPETCGPTLMDEASLSKILNNEADGGLEVRLQCWDFPGQEEPGAPRVSNVLVISGNLFLVLPTNRHTFFFKLINSLLTFLRVITLYFRHYSLFATLGVQGICFDQSSVLFRTGALHGLL